jgi:hypothetical protein
MVQETRKSLVLAKVETQYGSDPTPTTAANAILVMDLSLKPIKTPVERPKQTATYMNKQTLLGEEMYEVSFKSEIVGSGTPGTAPRVGALLQACGLSETIITGGSPSVNYRDASSSLKSVTLYCYQGGRLHKVVGCVGNVKVICEAGKQGMLEFTLQGLKGAAPAITTIPTDAVYDDASGTVPICKNGTFSYNSKTTLVTPLLEVDLQNVIAKRPDLASTYAIKGFVITDRNPTATINPETEIYTSYDFYGDALTNLRQLSYAVGSLFTFEATKFNPNVPELEDAEGILHDKMSGQIVEDASNGYSLELKWEN